VPTDNDIVDSLTRVLVRACRKLSDVGHPQEAARFAADGWVAVRHDHPRQAQHLDGIMHHIARVEARLAEQQVPQQPATPKGNTMSEAERILDVRTEIPKRRHELIFESFGDLPVGETYVLVNDHDPKPLRYQFEAENAGEFSGEYLEQGPEVWRVRIGRVAAPVGA
jgi:uncharacterized protein (DUF2249 family)